MENGTLSGKRILVTGSSGFVGRNLVRHLAVRNEVYGLQLEEPGHSELPQNVHIITADLSRMERLVLPPRVDVVIHLAAVLDDPMQGNDPSTRVFFDVNVRGTHLVLEAARSAGIARFVYGSTAGVYGYGPRPFKESDPVSPDPLNFYILSKILSETSCRWFSRFMHLTILRLCAPYGPGTSNPRFLTLMERIERETTVDVSSPYGSPHFNPVYIEDAVRIIERACGLPGFQLLNVAGPESISPQALARQLADAMGKTVKVTPPDAGSKRNLVLDVSRVTQEMGYNYAVSLREGIRRTVAGRPGATLS